MKGWTEKLIQLPRMREARRFQTSVHQGREGQGHGAEVISVGEKLKSLRNNHDQQY